MLFLFSLFWPYWKTAAEAFTVLTLLFLLVDVWLLFRPSLLLQATRHTVTRMSLGHTHLVEVMLKSAASIPLYVDWIDELPEQFQERHFQQQSQLAPGTSTQAAYTVRPLERGVYTFGRLLLYASTRIGLVQRRVQVVQTHVLHVYPSFHTLASKELFSLPDWKDRMSGRQQVPHAGSTEFYHIREYVQGDDVRHINWKASARRTQWMLNAYTDEKSQAVYCLLDKGRQMKMPFDGLTLLDHSINAILHLSYTALQKEDRMGLITYAEQVHDRIPASRQPGQLHRLIECLYQQQSQFKESSLEALCQMVQRGIGSRSLLLLFTHFETWQGFQRQLPYLQTLHRKHLLCVILFRNTAVQTLEEHPGDDLESIYIQTIAQQVEYDKKRMVRALKQAGMPVIYTAPEHLSTSLIHQYLTLKARRML